MGPTLEFEEDGVTYVLGERYYEDYEDYVRNSTHYIIGYAKAVGEKRYATASRVYRRAVDILVGRLKVPESEVDRFELFDIVVRVLRALGRGKGYRGPDECATVAAYIYMYLRGFKVNIKGRGVRSLAMKALSAGFDGESVRRRFIRMAVERVAGGDAFLYRVLAASVAWLSRKMVRKPTLVVSCACRIASLVNPLYAYTSLVSRFKEGGPSSCVNHLLWRLGVRVLERTPHGYPLRVAFPQELCNELAKLSVEVPKHVVCG